MKKLFPLIVSLILLTACGNAQANISKKEDLFRVEKQTLTSEDLFNTMKRTDRATLVLQDAKEKMSADVELTDEMKKEAQEQLDMFKDIFGDDFEKTLAQIGMKDEKEYLEKLVYPELRFNTLVQKYTEENFADIFEKHPARKAKVLEVDPKKADEALKAIKEEGIDKVAEDFHVENSPFAGKEQVYFLSEESQLPAAISKYLKDTDKKGLSDVVKSDATESTYIIDIIAFEADDLKETLIEQYGQNQEIKEEITQELFRKHDFKVYDQTVYDNLLEHFPKYLNEEK